MFKKGGFKCFYSALKKTKSRLAGNQNGEHNNSPFFPKKKQINEKMEISKIR